MTRPRFRNDLVSKPIEENGQRFVDVTDPDSGKTFRFYEVEYAVACAMNGSRSVNELVDWARAELGLEPSARELETVISTLGDLGYLTGNNGAGDLDLALGSPGRSPMDSGLPERPSSEGIELGVAGKSPLGGPPKSPRPEAANLELGAAGFGGAEAPTPVMDAISHATAPAPAPMPAPPPEPDNMSTDLSAHLQIGTDDVKEAVRQSKVMEAVPIPPDLMMPDPAAPHRPQQVREPAPPPGATPIELPGRPAGMAAPPPRPAERPLPPKPKSGANLTIIMLIALLVVALGGAAYYFFVYAKDDEPEGTKRPRGAGVEKNVGDSDNAPPAKVVAMLKAGTSVEAVIKAPKAGRIEWIEVAGTEVTAGAIIARYRGFDRVKAKLATAVKSKERYQDKLERATERDNKSAMARAAADVERKEQDIENFKSELRTFAIMATKPGVVTPILPEGKAANVTEGDEVLKLASTTGPSATFEVPDPSKHEVGDKVEIAAESDRSLTAVCDVDKIEGKKVTIVCPPDSGIDEGAAVALKPPAP